MIDENLAWKENIDNLRVKVSRAIGVIRRAKKYVKQDALKLMYNSLVLPYFDYCSLVWNNCSQTLKIECTDRYRKYRIPIYRHQNTGKFRYF